MQNYLFYILGIVFLTFILYPKLSLAWNKNVNNVTAEEAHELMKNTKNLMIIDVRTKEEYKEGHIPGSRSIPVGQLSSRINELNKYKDGPLLLHCASGGRSPAAVRILLKHNFSNIYHMKHGLRGWKYGLK